MYNRNLISEQKDGNVILEEYIFKNYIPFIQSKNQREVNFNRILGVLKIIKSYAIVKKQISLIDENDLIMFLNQLKKDRGISKTTINRYRSRISSIFNHAIRSKIIFFNPVRYIPRAKEYPRERALSQDELITFLECCRKSANPELYLIVMIALYTGMRYSNIVEMKKSKIRGDLYFLSETETKSGNKQKIDINSHAKQLLTDFMSTYDNGDYIFKTRYIQRSFKTALKRADIYDFRFHDLRRTFATYLLNNGTNIKIIQSMLGHSSIVMTERYLAVDNQKRLDAAEKLCFIKKS